MKKLLVSVLAIAGLVACSQEQTIDSIKSKSAKMEFGVDFVENATRAAQDPSLKTEDLKGFDVWAYMDSYAGAVLVDENVELVNGAWAYANVQYWLPGHNYYFTAIAPMDSANWDYAQQAETISFTNVEGTEDLLFATAEQSTIGDEVGEEYDAVKLSFKHLLSKTKFTFVNGYATNNMDIVVSNIKMVAPKSAQYEINSAEAHKWTNYADEVTLAYGDVERIGAGAKEESTYERLTIPATAAQNYTITYDITVYSGEVVAFEVAKETILSNVAFEQGKAYNLVATITPENIIEGGLKPIEFTVVEIEDWVYVTEDEGQIAEAELRAAVQLGGHVELTNDVVLTAPLQVTKDLVLNLNGKTLKNAVENTATDVIVVAEGATLTIEGDGVIEAVSGNDGYTIIADGTVVINGGEFKAGKDANGEANAVVYVRGEGKAFVNGGYFPNENASNYVLNKKDADKATTVIEVRGGKFVGFNPAQSPSEYPVENFVAEGYYTTEVEAGVFVVADAYTVANVAGLQAALDANIKDIRFAADMVGDINIVQNEGTYYVIDGAGYKFDGSMIVNGLSSTSTDKSLVIKNVNFETAKTSEMNFIGYTSRYARNITIDNCTFTAPEGDVVAVKLYQAYNVVVKNCTVNGGHSLAQITSSTNVAFESNTVNSLRGINLSNSVSGGAVVKNCNIVATKADGYAVRVDNGDAVIDGCDLTAFQPVVLRKMDGNEVITFTNDTLTAGDEYQIFVEGNKPVLVGAVTYTCNK